MNELEGKIRKGKEKFVAGLPVCGNCLFWQPVPGWIEPWTETLSELDSQLGFCSIHRDLGGFSEGCEACEDFRYKILKSSWCSCAPIALINYEKYFGDFECNCGIEIHHYHCWLCKGVSQVGLKKRGDEIQSPRSILKGLKEVKVKRLPLNRATELFPVQLP